MMTNLFNSFDPSSMLNMSINWLSTFIGILIIPTMFWLIPSRWNILWINISSMLRSM